MTPEPAQLIKASIENYRVYYADGSTYAGDPFNAPALDVLVIVESDVEHGRRIVSGHDYYIREDDRWYGVDQIGMFAYLVRTGPKRILIGRMVTNDHFRQVYITANNDVDFPVRTAYHAFEKRV